MAKSPRSQAAAADAETKSKVQIPNDKFLAAAKPLVIKIGDAALVAAVKEFATGSVGWFAGEKIVIEIDGVPVKVQVGINMIVVGSKPE